MPRYQDVGDFSTNDRGLTANIKTDCFTACACIQGNKRLVYEGFTLEEAVMLPWNQAKAVFCYVSAPSKCSFTALAIIPNPLAHVCGHQWCGQEGVGGPILIIFLVF